MVSRNYACSTFARQLRGCYKIVCTNGFDTSLALANTKAISRLGADAILLPKLKTPKDINAVQLIEEDMRIWTITEIVHRLLNIIHPPVHGMDACESKFFRIRVFQ